MEIKNISEQANPLFKRKQVEVFVDAEITPSYEQTLSLLAEKFSTKPETIKIKAIYGSIGSKTFRVLANVYESKKDKESTERKSKKEFELEKKQIEEAEKPVEDKPTEKPTGPPVEAPVEEKPSEQVTPLEKAQNISNKENSEPLGEAKQ